MLTEERVDAIFKEMDGYVLELIPDPTSLGPQYFRDHIANCRNFLNRVGLVLNELNRIRLNVSSELRGQEAAYAMEFDNLLTNEPSVKSLDSIEDRKAAAGFRLRAQRTTINELKQQSHVLDSVYKVVSFRNRELHATMTAIKDQSKMMTAEIRSGNFYGDERTSGGSIVTDEMSAEELAELMSEPSEEDPAEQVEQPAEAPPAEVRPVAAVAPTTPPVEEEPLGEPDVLKFLAGDATASAVTASAPAEEEDFSAFFDGL